MDKFIGIIFQELIFFIFFLEDLLEILVSVFLYNYIFFFVIEKIFLGNLKNKVVATKNEIIMNVH